MPGLITIKKFSIEEVLEKTIYKDSKSKNKEDNVKFGYFMVNMTSQRYNLFKLKGTKCVCCGLEASYFLLQQPEGQKCNPHFNLYGINKNGKEVLFTKDHIIAKSKGGKNHIDNYQTMCERCNTKKHNRDISLEDLRKELQI